MDGQEFMVSLFASFRICGVYKVYHESLETFLNDATYSPSFKEKIGDIKCEDAIKELDVLEALGIIKLKKRFKSKWYENTLSEDVALRMLASCPKESVSQVLTLGLKYKQLANMWDEVKEISYEEKYSVITNEFTEEYMKESIKLINGKRGN